MRHSAMEVFGHFLAHLPSSRPFIYLGGSGSQQHIFSWDFSRCPLSDLSSRTLPELSSSLAGSTVFPAHVPRYVGLVSYDESCASYLPQNLNFTSSAPSQLLNLRSVLTLDASGGFVWHGDPSRQSQEDLACYLRRFPCADERYFLASGPLPALKLQSADSEQHYRWKVEQVLADIRRGRYYQLNLLRTFCLPGITYDAALPAPRQLWWQDLVRRFVVFSEEMSALFSLDDFVMMSFSPERFVRIQNLGVEGFQVMAHPIKGTRERGRTVEEDRSNREALEASVKDGAELNMIIDLMRHDLTRISQLGSTRVRDAGSIKKLAAVYHRVACVSCKLNGQISLGDIANALLPAGSITGAPKKEVMCAIAEYEKRARGYFMGNVFTLSGEGEVDSSVLIRTMILRRGEVGRYAAGSGIVALSHGREECAEIAHKCRIWNT